LGYRPEIDPPLPAVMLGLVGLGLEAPNPPGLVEVDRPHLANLLRPHAGNPHQLYHRPDLGKDMGTDRINERIGDRLDGLRFPDIGPAASETGDRDEAVMEGGRDDPLPDGPLEQSDDPTCSLVDLVPA